MKVNPVRVKPKKALGQHFLTDMSVASRIADTVDVAGYSSLPILEIGPGTGVLTRFLLQKGREVRCVELDAESVEYLKINYPGLPVIEADFLKLGLHGLFPGKFCLTGNYPYNISSQIFFRLLDYKDSIPVCTGMLQREVAERICAAPGSRTRGILSVLLQAWYDCEYLFTVSENVFNPPPKVKSGVLRLTRNSVTGLGCDEAMFKRVVKTAFGMRRKTLRNSLASMLPPDSELRNDPLLGERPERLTVAQFIHLTRALTPTGGSKPTKQE